MMTVEELTEILKDMPPDAIILVETICAEDGEHKIMGVYYDRGIVSIQIEN